MQFVPSVRNDNVLYFFDIQYQHFTQYKAEKKAEREKMMKEKHQEMEMMEEMKLF